MAQKQTGAGIPVLTPAQGNLRILSWIAIFYILWNPSWFNLSNGLIVLAETTMRLNVESGWKTLILLAIAAAVLVTFATLWRRYHQAVKDTSMFMLILYTLIVAFIVGIVVYAMSLLGLVRTDSFSSMLRIIGWTWQVPAGYFIGKGLNWVFEDRQTAGFQGTSEVNHSSHHDTGHNN